MENSFTSFVDSANSVLIMLPVKPNFDVVAAGLSLYLSLREGKEVNIVSPSQMTVGFNRLIGVNKIVTEVGNKNLTIKFTGYDAASIEKVSYDIEEGEFKLTVVPKTGFTSPQKEQIDLNYAGVSADLVILLGGIDDSDFPILETEEMKGVKIAHVGVRALASAHEVMSFAKPGSSISELVAEIIKNNAMSIDADVATNLLMGVEEGSENFGSSEVTPETFETFAWLMRNGGQRPPQVKLSPADFPPGAIPTTPFGNLRPHKIPVMPEPIQEDVDAADFEGTQETEADINPPDDWLQPKVFKGAPSQNMPDSFSENKG